MLVAGSVCVVELALVHHFRAPFKNVFKYSLVQLMQYVGGDAEVDVSERVFLPEGLHDVARDIQILACHDEGIATLLALALREPEDV